MSLTSIIFSGHDFPSVSRGKHQVPAEKTFLWLQRAGIVEIRSTSAAISRINRAKLRTKSFLFFFFFLFIYFILFFFCFRRIVVEFFQRPFVEATAKGLSASCPRFVANSLEFRRNAASCGRSEGSRWAPV